MPTFRMKRPRSPDSAGISNYKRQRLIEDLQNLSISDKSPSTPVAGVTTAKVVPDALNDEIWKAVSGQRTAGDDIYGQLWSRIRSSNLQVIKWYDGPKLVYLSWLFWFQRETNSKEMEVEDIYHDQNTHNEGNYNGYGFEPMLIDF
ncbi:LADA_0D04698g1_1 [Lachancea dasiensis]|uniref:LADA_0D04698g1_1 n=1 Tax=Lachancea dasiensis TaxID=1072105 RepID=A0A1G4J588_9SACH|nr:LADA_0D04698g1_1 [Lachancea dasiensis]